MLKKIVLLATLASSIVLLFILQSTSPSSSGPGGILAVFLLLYIVFFGVLSYALSATSWVLVRFFKPIIVKKPLNALSFSHSCYLASVVAIGPIMLFGVQSVGKLGIYEVLLVLLFISLGIFYVQKRLR